MGRGGFTQSEMEILRENPYVLNVNERYISYSPQFKLLFMEEYLKGKHPTKIFREAGFDSKILGSKRIERASARWKESYESGTLGIHNAVLGEPETVFGMDSPREQGQQNNDHEKSIVERCHQQEVTIRKLLAERELLAQICEEQKKNRRGLLPAEICAIIESIVCKEEYPGCVSHLCAAVEISTSTFYKYRRSKK